MVRCLTVCLSLLLTAGSAFAAQPNDGDGQLAPRKPYSKAGGVSRYAAETGRVIVKFTDQTLSRPNADGTITSLNAVDVGLVNTLARNMGLKFSRAINHSAQKLKTIESRAAAYSRKVQPDLAGMMYLDGDPAQLAAAAQILVGLPIVEFVEFEMEVGVVGGALGACCFSGAGGGCSLITASECTKGTFLGDGTVCGAAGANCNIGACCVGDTCSIQFSLICTSLGGNFVDGPCADETCVLDGCGTGGGCFAVAGTPFCNDEDCCTTVCTVMPLCCDVDIPGSWDIFCVQLANQFCDPAIGADRCNTSLVNGPCFEVHATPGCNDPICCALVEAQDDFCTTVTWSSLCVEIATELCDTGGGGVTPNRANLQGYLTPPPYAGADAAAMGFGGGICPPPLGPNGYCGEGLDLRGDPALPGDTGLYGLGQEFVDLGIGDVNGAKGLGIRVGVIEFAAYVDHEDLTVIPEPGQTMILNPLITQPDHGTACLGIIGADDDLAEGPTQEIGVVGIAPEATKYFFPIASVEEGNRLLSAISSAYIEFEPGDVLSYSIGPAAGCGTLASSLATRLMLQIGSESGIINCIAAGNSCCNLSADDPAAQDSLDAGAIIVGAVTPGRPYDRLGFSNHCDVELNPAERIITVSGWGSFITTTGYGDLFNGGTPQREYTRLFNGTSGACPMVAGSLACLQGLAKQFYGIPLNAGQMKQVIAYIPQSETLNPDNLFGAPDFATCAGDFDPDAEPNWVVGFIDLMPTAAAIVATSPIFDDSPLIDDIFIRRGILLSGNLFSLKAIDQNYLIIRGVRATPSASGGGPGAGPGLAPSPPSGIGGIGLVTDIDVKGTSDAKSAEAIQLTTVTRTTTSFTGIMMIEMFNYDLNKYEFVDFRFIGAVPTVELHDVQFPSRYINETTSEFVIRIWTVVPGNPSLTVHTVQHDFVGIEINPNTKKG
jgi:Subtilase family